SSSREYYLWYLHYRTSSFNAFRLNGINRYVMSIRVTSSGNFKRTEKFLKKMSRNDIFSVLSHYGEQGVRALASSTPSESGVTAGSWSYEITKRRNDYSRSEEHTSEL